MKIEGLSKLISGKFYNDVINMRVDSNNPELPDSDDLLEVTDEIVEFLDLPDEVIEEQYEEIMEEVQDVWSQNNPSL